MKPLPFLTAIRSETRPLASALRPMPTASAPSPWTPKTAEPAALQTIDVEAERARGLAEGREQGLRETAELRARLASLVDELARARDAAVAPAADMIADAAATVIATWTATAPKTELFAPIVNAWVASAQGATVAHVNPEDVATFTAIIDDHAIVVEGDPTITPGDVRLRSNNRELSHKWTARLDELRETIATALTDRP